MHREHERDRTSLIALGVALAASIGMVIAVPSLIPRPVRDLVGLGPQRFGALPHPSGTGPYAFLAHQPGQPDVPVGYDPCTPIAVRVNLAGAPSDGLDLVKRAMAEVERDTGLKFDYQGTTTDRPHWDTEFAPTVFGQLRTVPVLVSWATSKEVGQLAGDVVGIGGSAAVADAAGRRRYVTGGVTLDSDDFATMNSDPDGPQEELAVILHEFGHLVGLAHVADPRELMYADNVGQLSYAAGDLEGLAKIGAISCA